MNQWEVFVGSLDELAGEQEREITIRTLNPGIHKYTYKRVRAQVSESPDKYPDRLQVRFGRGQPAGRQYSIQVLGEVQRFPDRYL